MWWLSEDDEDTDESSSSEAGKLERAGFTDWIYGGVVGHSTNYMRVFLFFSFSFSFFAGILNPYNSYKNSDWEFEFSQINIIFLHIEIQCGWICTDSGELIERDSTPTRAGTRIEEFIQNASEVIPEESTSADYEQVERVKGNVKSGEVHVSKNETNTGELETISPFESLHRSNKTSARESEELILAENEAALLVNSSLNSTTQHEEPLKTATEKLAESSKTPEEKQFADNTTIEANLNEKYPSLPLGESASNHSNSNDTSAEAKNLSSAVSDGSDDESDDEAEEEPPETAAEKLVGSFESQAEKRAQMIIDAYAKERRPSKPLGESEFSYSSSNATSAKAKTLSTAAKDEAEVDDEEESSQTAADNYVESSGSLTEKQNKTRIETDLKERRTSKPLGESAFNRNSSNFTAAKAKHLSTAMKDDAEDEAEDDEELPQTAAEYNVESSGTPAGRRNQTIIVTYPKEKRTSKPLRESTFNHSSSHATAAREKNLSAAMKIEAEDEAEEVFPQISAEKFDELSETPARKKTVEALSKERLTSKPLVESAINLGSSNVTAAKVKNLSTAVKDEANLADDAAEEEPLESAAENLVEPSELPVEKKTANRTAIGAYSKDRITSKRLGASASNHSSLNTIDAKPNSLSSTLKDEAEDELDEEPSRTAAEKFVESSELSTEKQTAGNTTTEAYSTERHTLKSLGASATNHSLNATDAKNLSSAMKVEADEVASTQGINSLNAKNTSQKCDYSVGSWVKDNSRPLYSGLECKMWLSPVFACRLNKHPDKQYDRYRWQPAGCNLPVFNASAVLETWAFFDALLLHPFLMLDFRFSDLKVRCAAMCPPGYGTRCWPS